MHSEQEFRFGQFRLMRSRRLLLEDDKPIRLGSRALDLLTALLERAGEVVSKEDLIAYAWPTTIVEESSLRFHLSSLRKVLGDGQQGARYIANVSGRGYCFVANVESIDRSATPNGPSIDLQHAHNLPVRLTRMIGRSSIVETIARLLPERRLITIVGPGGMGKSTLALALCDEVMGKYPHGAWFVDLAPVSDGKLVTSALATALGASVDETEPMRSLSAYLRDKQILIFLDNCERVVDAAAGLAQDLLAIGKDIHVIATSRERLGAKAEWIQRLPPLEVPEFSNEFTASEALKSSAVQLFVERAMASQDSFELHDWEAMSVVEICRRLDWMPLAIELAAAHVDAFGVSGLLAQMDDRLPLLYRGRRAVPARHQTLKALLDWSYDLLTESDRMLLRHLAVFTGAFTLKAANAVAFEARKSATEISLGIESLASQSLLVVVPHSAEMHYRLLDTTRAYAFERLEESDALDGVRRRHASYLCEVLAQAEADWATWSRAEWLAVYAPYVDDVRGALDWAIRSPENLQMNVGLAAGACALAIQLSLQAEFSRRIGLAMDLYLAAGERDPLLELHLCSSLALLRLTSEGPDPETDRLFFRALEMANQLNSDRFRADAINGVFVSALYAADYPLALKHADSLGKLALQASDALMALAADRIRAQVLFMLGNFKESKRLAERVLRHPTLVMRLGSPYPMDRRVSMRILLAQILWIEGYPEQAMEVSIQCQQLSESEHVFAQCIVLSWAACPVAMWTGELDLAGAFIEKFKHRSSRSGFAPQYLCACEYERVVQAKQGGRREVTSPDEDALDRITTRAHLADVMGTMGERFLTAEAISRLESGAAPWCAAEILRARGERAMKTGRPEDEEKASSFFDRSLRLAQQQGALSWELRTAMSMAALKRKQGRAHEGHEPLRSVFSKFTEGFETADLLAAKDILRRLDLETEA